MGYDQPRSLGGYAQGGRIAAPIFKQWAQVALKNQPKVPFVAPPGIRWVRVDRATGKPVFGIFPTVEDPKAAVIWEAFQPQTEEQRSFRSSIGDPYNSDQQQQAIQAALQQQLQALQQRQAAGQRSNGPVEQPPAPVVSYPQAASPALPTKNSL
jgi:penicillin-binding protein 1A